MFSIKSLELLNSKCISLITPKKFIYHLTGENGSGKSLLLKSLANLIDYSVESFIFEEKDLAEYDSTDYRKKVLYLSSQVEIYGIEDIQAFLEFPIHFKSREDFKYSPSLDRLLIKCQLNPSMKLVNLSSGQLQLIAFLRALYLGPKVLLIDESLSNLDSSHRAFCLSLLGDKIQKGLSLIFVSHEKDFFKELKPQELNMSDILLAVP